MKDRPGGGRASVLPSWSPCGVGWVWNLVRSLVGVGLAHCWVLKDQAGWFESSGPPSSAVRRVVGGGWLVGLLFEICIVDASILYRCRRRA